MTKKIFGVLGLGIFGRAVAEELSKFEQEVIALDRREGLVQDVADMATKAAVGDITEIGFLKVAGIAQRDVVVIATGNTSESSVLATMHCKKLGVKTTFVKVKDATYKKVLHGTGTTKAITSECDSGKRVASNMPRHHIESVIHIEDNIAMVEFSIPDSWIGKSLARLDPRHKYDLNLTGIHKKLTSSLDTHISPNQAFEANTEVVAIADDSTLERFDYLGYLK